MTQAIPILIVNLARREDRIERLGGQLSRMGLEWERVDALDALTAPSADLDSVIALSGPLGRMGNGDRACTVSHLRAWARLLARGDEYALVLEDDAYLARDIPALLRTTSWIPAEVELIKLEKFGEGASMILLGPAMSEVPGGQRHLHRMYSRHVGGAAYIISRRAAAEGLKLRGKMRVPVDHLLFNGNVSPLSRKLRPTVVRPAIATQRRYGYNSDVAALGKAVRPKGWRRRARSLKRGFYEVRLVPLQLCLAIIGRARLLPLTWQDDANADDR